MPVVLVTGSNRGIGLEFVRQYAAEGWRVHAACRNPDRARELAAVSGDVTVHRLDVTDDAAVGALATALEGEGLDVLINNAGLLESSSFGRTDGEAWLRSFRVNCIAPIHLLERFTPHLERGKLKRAVAITSKMGSIADNTSGGSYIYRSSKAALNAAMRSAAIDLRPKGIIVAVLHPGWVKTDMGGPGALMAAATSVSGMRARIAALSPADSGRFFNFDGQELPW
ncbi:MAG TPA: SDR family oxidoreductase [Hyphomicrobiaceae bacterium]|nr:SDR family oxidoreductase [Hyphomicrobiaceae bacterium]